MARLFPFRSEPAQTEGAPRVVDLEGEDADAVFGALSSTTAREIYARLEEEPGTPSDVADAIDSSIQNVRYHLEKLEDAGLIEVVDTWYSSRGNEMSVYAATDGPLIVTGDESTATRLRSALSRFVGGIGALAGGSVLVEYGLTRWAESAAEPTTTDDVFAADDDMETRTDDVDDSPDDPDDDAGIMDAEDDEPAEAEEAEEVEEAEEPVPEEDDEMVSDGEPDLDEVNESLDAAPDGGVEAAESVLATVPPGLLFFLGGFVVLVVVTVYWYWYRPVY